MLTPSLPVGSAGCFGGAGEQQGDVVLGVGAKAGQHAVAQLVQWLHGAGGQSAGEPGQAVADVLATAQACQASSGTDVQRIKRDGAWCAVPRLESSLVPRGGLPVGS